MGLLQRRTQIGNNLPVYTIGGQQAALIIGLGNPGGRFQGTRHNIGFAVLDYLAEKNDFPAWINKKDLVCQLTIQTIGHCRVLLCKPSTYMNDSGRAATAVQRFYRIANRQTVAVYDELAMPFGTLRSRVGGQSAGHNGVKSLIAYLGADFGRLRVGIGGRQVVKTPPEAYVLKPFSKTEQKALPALLKEANSLLSEFIFSGDLPHDTRSIL